jgi:aminomethyltransferase
MSDQPDRPQAHAVRDAWPSVQDRPFAGYEMPVQYPTGITVEHKAVREHCGLFDVSHMGEFLVRGPQAVEFVNYVTTNNVLALAIGQVQYSGILNERGTFEDDCLVYREADGILMVVNASNKDKDFAHISRSCEVRLHAHRHQRRYRPAGAARARG